MNNNEFILPKTACFDTVHWCQSWGPRVHMVLPQHRHWGGGLCPPRPPCSAAYVHGTFSAIAEPLVTTYSAKNVNIDIVSNYFIVLGIELGNAAQCTD